MLEDRFYQICKQNYPLRILVHATYSAKQTLASKGITPAIFLSPFYLRKGDYSMEIAYGSKQKNYKPFPQIFPIDYSQYQNRSVDDTFNQACRQIVAESQCKIPKNVTVQTFKHRQSIQNYLNNLNFHWFENSIRNFYYSLSLNQTVYKKSTLQQPKGIAFVMEVNDKSLKQNFDKIKKQVDVLLKRMFYLNPNHIKLLPIMVVLFYDPSKNYPYKDVKIYADALKSDYGIQSVLTAKMEINGPLTADSISWSQYTRPLFTFNYKLTPSDPIKLLNEQGSKCLIDTTNIHKQRIKKMLQIRLQSLMKKYQDSNSLGSKFFGFVKGNASPKQKFLITQEAESREIADLMFILSDYKKAHDVYKNIHKDFEKRESSIQMDLRYMMSLCYQMGKFQGVKVNSTSPKAFIQKQSELFQLYEKQGRRQLSKFLILFLYQLHTFKIFDQTIIKERFLIFIKKAMNMAQQKKGEESHKHGQKHHFLVPTLLYEQYSNINLLYPFIDYRRYCYDTVRVSLKYVQYRLFSHALRCLLSIQKIYKETFYTMQKYIAVHLSSNSIQNKNFQDALDYIKKAWKILSQNTNYQEYYLETQINQFKKMLLHHSKNINQLEKLSPNVLTIPDDKNLVIPHVIRTEVRLSGEETLSETVKTGVTWTEISQYFSQTSQLYSQGYNKAAMQKIFKLYDCAQSEQKELIYRAKCPSISEFSINRFARVSYLKQPIRLSFTFHNPFIQQIKISNFKVLIKDSYKNFEVIDSPNNQILLIKAQRKEKVSFQIIPNQIGILEFEGLEWTFEKMRTKYTFRDARTVESQLKPFYTIIKIVEPKGKLKVHQQSEQQFFEGQNYESKVILQNCGQKTIQSIYIAFGCHQFYGKKYEKLNIQLQPKEKKQITFNLALPSVPQSIQKDWKLMDKKVFLYKTEGQFRVYRSSIQTLINKVLFSKIKCEKLSTHLHLLTFLHDRSYSKQALIESMTIKSGFEIAKTDHTIFENSETYFFFLTKHPQCQYEVFNFSSHSSQRNFNFLSLNTQRLKKLQNNKVEEKIDLVFGWRTQANKRNGLIQMKPLNITPLKQQILPFSFSTTMPFSIKHNFRNQPILETNFEIKIKNIFHHKDVSVKIQFIFDNVNGIYWEGITEKYFKLKHNGQAQFDIGLVISKPGIYDISDCIKYSIQIDRQLPIIRHSEHEKLMMHITSPGQFISAENEKEKLFSSDSNSRLSTQINFAQFANIAQNLPFSKKNSEGNNKVAETLLLNKQDTNLLSSPRYKSQNQAEKQSFDQIKIKTQPQTLKQEKNEDLIDLL